jgi:hypothetical protein
MVIKDYPWDIDDEYYIDKWDRICRNLFNPYDVETTKYRYTLEKA